MNAITNMDLDTPDFIDLKAFDQSKAILVNALDELELYIKYFNNAEYEKFPKAPESVGVKGKNSIKKRLMLGLVSLDKLVLDSKFK